jgi:DNA-binding winged helix-turn-helix (wHTH) protein/tetratricopeptide (TPR) repeat protein
LPADVIQFDDFELDLGRYELRRADRVIKLEKNPMELLILLVENQGRLVTREAIIQRLWGDNVFVDTRHGINTAVHKLRNALRDDSEQPRILETVVGKGYRLVAAVAPKSSNGDDGERVGNVLRPDAPVVPLLPVIDQQPGVEDVKASPSLVVPEVHPQPAARKYLVAGILTLLLISLGALAYRFLKGGAISKVTTKAAGQQNSPTVIPRRSVAVLGFQNLSGQQSKEWVSTAISEMLTTELAAGEQLRVASGEDVARAKVGIAVPEGGEASSDKVMQLRKSLRVDYVVVGSFYDVGKSGNVRLDLRLEEALSGNVAAIVGASSTETNLPELVSRAGSQLRLKLELADLSPFESHLVRASLPSRVDAAKLYVQALDELRVFEALKARDLLERCAAIEPNFALTHSALATAWSDLGYDDKAKQEAKQAYELSTDSSVEDRLQAEGRYQQLAHQWGRAVDAYKTLSETFPDDLEYGIALAITERQSGNAKAALEVIHKLHDLPSPLGNDPRIDLEEAASCRAISDFVCARTASDRAFEAATAMGQIVFIAQARRKQSIAFDDQREPAKALAASEEARKLFASVHDDNNAARVLNDIGVVYYHQGNLVGARKAYEGALANFERTGNVNSQAIALGNLANVLQDQGDLVASQGMEEKSFAAFKKTNNKAGMANVSNNLAAGFEQQGDLGKALELYKQSLQMNQDLSDKHGIAVAMNNIANVLTERGDLAESRKVCAQALQIEREIDDKDGIAYALYSLAELETTERDLTNARSHHEQALQIRISLEEAEEQAESRRDLAIVALEQERYSDAEKLADEAAVGFKGASVPDMEVASRATLASVLLAEGKISDAAATMSKVHAASQDLKRPGARLPIAVTSARVLAASERSDSSDAAIEAKKVLRAVLAEAKKDGYLEYQFEARLALAEIEVRTGHSSAARAALVLLERDARQKSFVLMASKAAKLRVSAISGVSNQ